MNEQACEEVRLLCRGFNSLGCVMTGCHAQGLDAAIRELKAANFDAEIFEGVPSLRWRLRGALLTRSGQMTMTARSLTQQMRLILYHKATRPQYTFLRRLLRDCRCCSFPEHSVTGALLVPLLAFHRPSLADLRLPIHTCMLL
jgi:hypothetical protein